MKRVIALLPNFFGGGEKITSTLVSALSKVGFRFVLVTDPRWVEGRGPELLEIYDDIITLPLVGAHFSSEVTQKVAEAIAPLRADTLWMIGDDFCDIPLLRNSLVPGGRIVFHLHSVPYYQVAMKTDSPVKSWRERLFKSYSKRYRLRMAQTICSVDAMVVLCEAYRQQLVKEFPDSAQKILAIYNPGPQTSDSQPPTDTIAYVGRLTRSDKRVDNLLRILALAKPWQHGWRVRIIGEGPEREYLNVLAEKLNLHYVEFCGFQSPPNLSGAQIICLTSDFEGWPTALIEGMQYGAVPIAFGCSAGVSEILADGRGIEIPPGNLKAYADALNRLIQSPELRKKMIVRAKPFLESLNINNIIGKWQEIL